MALTQTGADGIKDDAVTADKLANAINTDIAAKAALTGSTNNTITTVTGANAIQGEANLTYDGDILSVGTGSGGAILKVQGAEGGNAEIWLQADEGDDDADNWLIYHNASDNQLKFASKTTGSYVDKLILDSNGRVGIAENDPDTSLHVKVTSTEGIRLERNGGAISELVNDTDLSTLGTTNNFNLAFKTNNIERARVLTDGSFKINDGNLDIATAGHGINFGATSQASGATSELFDDYEEGTFDPRITFGGGNTGITYGGATTGTYTKIGRAVNFRLYIALSDRGSSTGNAKITGLPFTSAGSYGYNAVACWSTNLEIPGARSLIAYVDTSSTNIALNRYNDSSGDASWITENYVNSNAEIMISGNYIV